MTRRHDPSIRGFASDNYAGVHPEVLEAITAANEGHQSSYGADQYTEALQDVFKRHFAADVSAYPVFNGTGANVVALQALTDRFGAVICTDTAHIHVDECGAPERVGGLKLLAVPAPDGKLTPDLVDREAYGMNDEHRAKPQAVSITQTTELGTAYSVEEITAICEHAHSLGMLVHLDGARIGNAAASLGTGFDAFTTRAGVDIVSFGGTKNGLMVGEAVVVINPEVDRNLLYVRKSLMQLGSKLRFVSAQFDALLRGDLWHRNAAHANAMANRLYDSVRDVPGVDVLYPVQANAVFARLPVGAIVALQRTFAFYNWAGRADEVRWMCSFDTTAEDVDSFAAAIAAELSVHA